MHFAEVALCANDDAARKVAVEVPEIGSQEVLGEWLIPKGEVLLVSFGAYTVADSSGKAVVKERLAVVEAGEAGIALPILRATPWVPVPNVLTAPLPKVSVPAPVAIPETIAPPAPVTIAPPAPVTMAPARTRAAAPVTIAPPAPVTTARSRKFPWPCRRSRAARCPRAFIPTDDRPNCRRSRRTDRRRYERFGLGLGRAAAQPANQEAAHAETDRRRRRDQNDLRATKSPTVFLPSLFMPSPSVGLQFLLPLKPLSLRLPFGQRMEIEIYGKVVPDQSGK